MKFTENKRQELIGKISTTIAEGIYQKMNYYELATFLVDYLERWLE